MNPTQFKQANITLKGPEGSDVKDLPTCTDGNYCLSCWTASFRERLMFLLTGKAWLWVFSGGTQPPVCVSIDEPNWHAPLSVPEDKKVEPNKSDISRVVSAVFKRKRRDEKRRRYAYVIPAVFCLLACSLGCAPLTHPMPPVKLFNQDHGAAVSPHDQLDAMRKAHAGLNFDQWPDADREAFDSVLAAEVAAQ